MQLPTIQLTQEDVAISKQFSKKVVIETYNRFNKGMNDRIERIFFGKLGELALLKYLNSKNIYPDTKGMFEIYEGESNVDKFDFFTDKKESIDVKTAYKSFHKRILVPYDQFENGNAKDFYVGIYIDTQNYIASIAGYTTKSQLLKNSKINFGEGFAYWEFLSKLEPIEKLLTNFKVRNNENPI